MLSAPVTLLRRVGLCLSAIALIPGIYACSSTAEVDPPGSEVYVPTKTGLDPELDSAAIEDISRNSTMTIHKAATKRPIVTSLDDSIRAMLDLAVSMVSSDPAKHIHYVWGGKQLVKPTAWSTPPDTNGTCAPRFGLDCSGFVQYVFDKSGFGRQALELNAQSLSTPESWKFLSDRGYFALSLDKPSLAELLPGDVLFFTSGSGTAIVHTGVFWTSSASINGQTGPAMINASGYSSCYRNYAREAAGTPSGVIATRLDGLKELKLASAMRFINSNYLDFKAYGNLYFAYGGHLGGFAVLDTLKGSLRVVGCEEQVTSYLPACFGFSVDGISGPGTYPIPQLDPHDSYLTELQLPGEESLADSLVYFATSPPDWWHGPTPPATGGELKILAMNRSRYVGSITGTFKVKVNSYYTRYEDSTYVIDTTTITTQVVKYYYQSTDVEGKFGGLMAYE